MNVALVLASLALAEAASAAEFFADLVERGGGRSAAGKFYVKGDKVRQETVADGKTTVVIVRMDKGVVWNLNPAEKKYAETENVRGLDWGSPETRREMEKVADRRELGTEKVNGYVCQKIQWVFKDKSMGTLTQWISTKLRYPIRMEQRGSMGELYTEYRNIRESKLADSLFELPPGYRKTEIPPPARERRAPTT